MALTLTWQRYKDNAPPFSQSEALTEASTIGRAPTNQIVVHDPDKYVSRCHAEIYEVGGNWFIKDQSSTVTIVNGSVNLVKGQQFLLSEGDEITIGESVYVVADIAEESDETEVDEPVTELQPAIDPNHEKAGYSSLESTFPETVEEAYSQTESSSGAYHRETNRDNLDQSTPADDVFNIDDFFSETDDGAGQFSPTANDSQYVENNTAEVDDFDEPNFNSEQPTGNPSQDTVALRAFLQELDMQPSQLIGQNKVEVLKVAGILLRTLTEGMMGVLKARALMKEKLELDQTQISHDKNNAFKFSQSSQDALVKMLTQEHGYMDPISAANEAVDDAKAHQLAMISGLNIAIQQTIEAFDPKHLEQEFEVGFSLNKKAKYWDHYCKIYERVAENAQIDSSNIFLKHFREHYEMQLLKLVK
ncbi:type VI secretion system-associated FHA domain protein TagH [Alteromonas sp. ASW11-130]|uniref:type VI secretion system-associated FHA domain protein TagH n=1 Tax=Alteromonas sp. ASW11-130 TaxID=3015775 RepID=UPI0022429FCC|nr:type VI secretion system-associated FHA domain protein TagH [Alteromonas sp. ASW11-130]MCW8090312.1 type VI secretion system-associated FHA domain protein TagH [Alteromonas sp. ASW11-130]